MTMLKFDMEVRGPVLTRGPRVVRDATRDGVKELVELGMERLATTLRPRPSGVYLSVAQARPGQASTGNYRRHLQARFTNLNALISDGGVVYGPWLEGTGSRNQTTRFKGYASFRRTKDWLDKRAASVFSKHIRRATGARR